MKKIDRLILPFPSEPFIYDFTQALMETGIIKDA